MKNNENHGRASEDDGKTVKFAVGNHDVVGVEKIDVVCSVGDVEVAVDLLRLSPVAPGGKFKWVLGTLFCCSKSCQYGGLSDGQTDEGKCQADFSCRCQSYFLCCTGRTATDFEGDDIKLSGVYGQLSTLRAATQGHMYRYISICH